MGRAKREAVREWAKTHPEPLADDAYSIVRDNGSIRVTLRLNGKGKTFVLHHGGVPTKGYEHWNTFIRHFEHMGWHTRLRSNGMNIADLFVRAGLRTDVGHEMLDALTNEGEVTK